MAIFRHTADVPEEARGTVVVVGNFDGVHLGHRAVLDAAHAEAARLGTAVTVLTFEPHPRAVFQPDLAPFRLTPLRIKARVLEHLGVAHLFVQHFDLDFARRSAESFVRDILAGDLAARHVVVGHGFRFGHKRQGDAALLERMGGELGFGVTAVPPSLDPDGEPYSSSRIRRALTEGRPQDAAALLGRPWEVEGRVEHGEKRGQGLGFPTANLALGEYLQPALGIYAMRAGVDAGEETVWHDGAAYVGTRPTLDGDSVLVEAHLFGGRYDLYGEHLRVRLIAYLRGDKAFDSMAALGRQIAADCEQARRILSETPGAAARAAPPPGRTG